MHHAIKSKKCLANNCVLYHRLHIFCLSSILFLLLNLLNFVCHSRTQELVALSGAHTLGSKGFGNPNIFDNSYFKILIEKPWASSGEWSMIYSVHHAFVNLIIA